MGLQDLTFTKVSDGEVIFSPLKVVSDQSTTIKVTNFGEQNLTGLGLYIVPATNLGSVDNPADYPPETDYQDLLTWGSRVEAGLDPFGGLKLTVPQNTGTVTERVTRTKGSKLDNKIPFKDLSPGESANFTVEIETPPGVSARRLFVNLVME